MPAAVLQLAAVRVTQQRVFIRTGRDGRQRRRTEVVQAVTVDGAWTIGKEDSPGTPWWVTQTATGLPAGMLTTLDAARHHIGSGEAERELGRLAAHDAGGHAAERDPWCPRC
jgi:hypothetical protein